MTEYSIEDLTDEQIEEAQEMVEEIEMLGDFVPEDLKQRFAEIMGESSYEEAVEAVEQW